MKSYKPWCATLPLLAVLVACGGESSLGRGQDTEMSGSDTNAAGDTMGSAGNTMGSAGNTMGSTGSGGSMTTGAGGKTAGGGATSGGAMSSGAVGQGAMSTGNPPMPGSVPPDGFCMSDTDCKPRPCETCDDGSVVCWKTYCGGQCHADGPGCPDKCSDDTDCVKDDEWNCHECDDGRHCPVGSCSQGYCGYSYTGCLVKDPCAGLSCGEACDACGPNTTCDAAVPTHCAPDGSCVPGMVICPTEPECKVSEDCPSVGDMCKECSNGKCAQQACLQGSCELVCPFE